jgi:hypothetical protein
VRLEAVRGRTDEDRPPICPVCGVTLVPAELSAHLAGQRDWVCLECEDREADYELVAARVREPDVVERYEQ